MSVVQSVVGQVPRLLYSNGQLGNSRDWVFVDFVGLGCKSSSKKSRRRVGISSTTRSTRGLLGKNWSSSSIRAVLDLERIGTCSSSSSSSTKVSNDDDNDSKPKV